jgi:methionine synthase I (cobalamin-dependent)
VAIAERLPEMAVVGGCCGTDLAHLDRSHEAAFEDPEEPSQVR